MRKITLRIVLDVVSLSFWIDGNNPGWYIAEYLFLTLIFPIIYYFLRKKTMLNGMVIIIVDIWLNYLILSIFPAWFWKVEVALTRVPVFVLGCIIAKIDKKRIQINQRTVCLACIGAAGIIGLILYSPNGIGGEYSITRYTYAILALLICIITGYICCNFKNSKIVKATGRIGIYTLPIYLTHTQILSILNTYLLPILKNNVLINIIAVFIVVPIATLANMFQKKMRLQRKNRRVIC